MQSSDNRTNNSPRNSGPNLADTETINNLLQTIHNEFIKNNGELSMEIWELADTVHTHAGRIYENDPLGMIEYSLSFCWIFAKHGHTEEIHQTLDVLEQQLFQLTKSQDYMAHSRKLAIDYLIPSYLACNSEKALQWCDNLIGTDGLPLEQKITLYKYKANAHWALAEPENTQNTLAKLEIILIKSNDNTSDAAEHWLELAQNYSRHNDSFAALRCANKSLEIISSCSPVIDSRALRAEIHFLKAVSYEGLDDVKSAQYEYKTARKFIISEGMSNPDFFVDVIAFEVDLLSNNNCTPEAILHAFQMFNYALNHSKDNDLIFKLAKVYYDCLLKDDQYQNAKVFLLDFRARLIESLPEDFQRLFAITDAEQFSSSLRELYTNTDAEPFKPILSNIAEVSVVILNCYSFIGDASGEQREMPHLIWQCYAIRVLALHETAKLALANTELTAANNYYLVYENHLANTHMQNAEEHLHNFSHEECPEEWCCFYTLKGLLDLDSGNFVESQESYDLAIKIYNTYKSKNLESYAMLLGLKRDLLEEEYYLYATDDLRENLISTICELIDLNDKEIGSLSYIIELHSRLLELYEDQGDNEAAIAHGEIVEKLLLDYNLNNPY